MNIAQYLAENGTLTYTNRGVSMWPLLREGRDMFTLRRKTEARCRRGDVVLYTRGRDYVLHRIIDVRKDDYVILGDNCIQREYGITDSDILGVMTGFIRGGREHSVDGFGFRLYTFIILHTITIRTFTKRVISWIIHRL